MWHMPGYADRICGCLPQNCISTREVSLFQELHLYVSHSFDVFFSLAINLFDENCSLLMLTRGY